MEDSNSQLKEARLYLGVVKERFHGENVETYRKFKALLQNHTQQADFGIRETEILFSKVKDLFGKHEDLVSHFGHCFLPYLDRKKSDRSTPVGPHVDLKIRPSPDRESLKNVVKTSIDYINRARDMVKDDKLFKSLLQIIMGFQKHKSGDRVKREAFSLLKQYPALKMELSRFLAEAMGGKSVREELNAYKDMVFECESEMHEQELLFRSMLFAKEAAERLVSKNWDMDPLEKIDTGAYFSTLDVKCVKQQLKGRKHTFEKVMLRRKAVEVSKEIVHCLQKKIEELTRLWSPQKEELVMEKHEEEGRIPTWDWHLSRVEVQDPALVFKFEQ